MTRPDWWTWHGAAVGMAPNPHVLAAAMVWAGQCWSWQRGDTPDHERAHPIALDKLAASFPYSITPRRLRGHLASLVEIGLLDILRGPSRYGPKVYAPALPNTGQQRPVLGGNTGQQRPVLGGNTGQQRPVLGGNTGQQRPVSDADTVPPLAEPPARARTRAREPRDGEGGSRDPLGIETLAALTAAMDRRWGAGTAARLTSGWRWRAIDALGRLRGAGWPPDLLVDRLNAREWASAGSVGRALMARLDDLTEEPPPTTAAERAAARAAEADVEPCDHGTPGGCARCHMCRRGIADEDGVTCTKCANDALNPPPGYTPALFAIGSPDPATDSPQ